VNYIILSAAVIHGLGRHARFVRLSRRKTALELLFISQVVWYWSITLVKLSVAILLLRLKRTRTWRVLMYSIMALLLLVAIVQTCFQFLQCRPFSIFWDPGVLRRTRLRCLSRKAIDGNIILFSAVQVSVDLIFSFIPITFIAKLNRPRREKVFMCVLMGLGLFASVAAIVRTLYIRNFARMNDFFRIHVSVALWAVIEQQFALIAATIPTLKAFLEKSLLRLGVFFYDEKSESEVRSVLVQFGFLDERAKNEQAAAVETQSPPIRKERTEKGSQTLADEDDDDDEDDENSRKRGVEKDVEKELDLWRLR
jgi:hypothetical protein